MLRFASSEILDWIEQHWQNLVLVRSLTPFLKDTACGYRVIQTAAYYSNMGYKASIRFEEPLTQELIDRINLATHWVNQGFVVALFAHLEFCGVVGLNIKINHEIDGWEEIDLLRWLRKWFAHTSGFYKPSDSEQKETYELIIKHFEVNQSNYPESDGLFPIPIDEVLEPLVEGCKRYVRELYGRKT